MYNNVKATGGGPGVKNHVGLIWLSFVSWTKRFLQNCKSSLRWRVMSIQSFENKGGTTQIANFKCDFLKITKIWITSFKMIKIGYKPAQT